MISSFGQVISNLSELRFHRIIIFTLYAYNDNLANIKAFKNINSQYEFNELLNIDRVYEEIKYAIETKLDLIISEIEKRQECQNKDK